MIKKLLCASLLAATSLCARSEVVFTDGLKYEMYHDNNETTYTIVETIGNRRISLSFDNTESGLECWIIREFFDGCCKYRISEERLYGYQAQKMFDCWKEKIDQVSNRYYPVYEWCGN